MGERRIVARWSNSIDLWEHGCAWHIRNIPHHVIANRQAEKRCMHSYGRETQLLYRDLYMDCLLNAVLCLLRAFHSHIFQANRRTRCPSRVLTYQLSQSASTTVAPTLHLGANYMVFWGSTMQILRILSMSCRKCIEELRLPSSLSLYILAFCPSGRSGRWQRSRRSLLLLVPPPAAQTAPSHPPSGDQRHAYMRRRRSDKWRLKEKGEENNDWWGSRRHTE